MEEQIDENLRRVYKELSDEAVPKRFDDLLRRLRDRETGGENPA